MTSRSLRLFHNSTSSQKILKLSKSFLVHLALISLIFEQFLFVASASAQALPINPDGSTNTQVTQTASGVDQVNIAAPNSSGLSHNKFTDYNVNTNGQVINNFSGKNSAEIAAGSGSTAVTATQIGGLVTANSNLSSSGSARVILNEVTSSNASQLLGYTEIAGTKADLILANPNGIACRGCGFINTARLFMVAGSSNFDSSGNLGFNLKEQANPNLYVPLVTIDGLGLDVSRTSSTDIIASSVKLLSTIYGSDNTALTIKTGEGRYDYATKNITGTNVQNNTSPVFAIDASSLAQIQAGQVYLIATKNGVGVNMEAEILASSTVNIDANGDVYYSKISAGDTANLTSTQKIQSTDSNSSISAPTINVTANEFKNLGLASAYNLNIQNSGTLTNIGDIEALSLNLSNISNINNSGSIYGENSLSISGVNLTNDSAGSIFSPQSYSVVLTGLLTNSGLINSGNDLSVSSNQLTNSAEISAQNNLTFAITNSATNSGNFIAGNALNLTATSFNNSGATQSGDNSNFNLASLTNSETASIYSAKNLTLNLSSSLTNSGEISSLGNFAIAGTSSITNSNQLLSNSNLSVIGSSLNNSSTGIIASLAASLTLALTGDLQNDGEFDSATNLTASAANFTNSGNILGNTNLILSSTNNFTNSGNLQSGSDTNITTSSLNNSGLIKSFATATVNADEITNQTSGVITSEDDLALAANVGGLSNAGAISSQNNFTLISSVLANSGTIYSANSLGITNSSDLTNSGTLYSDGSLSLSANNITNSSSGWIFSTTSTSLTSLLDFTNAGNLQATTDLNLNIGGNATNSGAIVGNQLTFVNAGDITNSGSIGSDNDLTVSATNLTNSGLIQNLGDAQINLSGNLTNQASASIYSGENLGVTASGSLANSGEISAVNSATFNVASLINSSSILANNDLTINSASVQNQSDATLASINDSLTLNLSDYLTNSGTIFAKENLTLANLTDNFALNSVNNSGDISFNSLVDGLLVKDFTNSGNLVSTQDLTVTSTNSFTNSGAVNSSQNLTLNNTSLNNSGEISAANILTVTASTDVTNSGNILSNGALTIGASNLTNNESSAIASLAGALALTLTNDLQNNGQLSSSTDLNIGSKNLTNVGDILGGNKLTITATNTVTNSGNFQSIGNFSLISASLDNSGTIKSFGTSSITASSISNQTDALIFSNSDSTITSSSSFTNSGSVLSNGKFDLTAALATNSSEIFSAKDLTLTLTNSFTNSGSLSSLGKIDINSTSSITNTNQILSGGNLSIAATDLSNSNTIQSNSNLTLNLASLSNSGNMVSGGTFNITASGNIANSSNLQSTDNFTINAASFTNSASSLILAGKDLTVRASSITNQNTKPSTSTITSGIVSANGNILLQTDTLNNNSGIIAGKSTTVNALNATSVNLYNTLGAFISTAVITLDLGALDYTITGTVTADNVDITANNIVNQGNVTASDYIKLNATGTTGASGSGNITNGFVSGDNSNVQLAAGAYVELTAKNNINNYGTISASTDLTLTSTNGAISNYNSIIGGTGTTTINTDLGSFNNSLSASKLTAANDLVFNIADDLNNYGEISVANDLTANVSDSLYNYQTALIWSGNDATFNVANTFFNNQADIYANNNLTIQKNTSLDASLNKTNLVQNISGNIETYEGDILIKASTLTNQRSSMKTQNYVYWQSGCNYHNHECHYDSTYTASINGTVGLDSSIISGNNLYLNLTTLNNDSASILAAKDIQIDAININNLSHNFEAYQNFYGDWWYQYPPDLSYKPAQYLQVNDQLTGYNYYSFRGHSIVLIAYLPVGTTPTFSYSKQTEVYSQKNIPNPAYVTESYPAYIKAGGALTITQNGSLNPSFINGSNVTQYAAVGGPAGQSRSTTINHVDSYTLEQTGALSVDLSRISSAISESSIASSGSNLNLSSTSTSSPTSVAVSGIIKGSISNPTGSIADSSVSASGANISSSSLATSGSTTVFSGNFKINLDPSATTPLVESRSQFTDASKFFGSSYYFTQLGLDGAAVLADIDRQTRNTSATRILGDSFVETKLILDQLKTLTNDSLFLSKTTTDHNQQIKELLDNSISEFASLGLNAEDVAMHGLTTAQANSLTKDIITFETTVVNGVNVLAPKIYLSQDTRNRILNSDSVTGGNALANSSTIFGKDSVTIDSPYANLVNGGSIVSGGNLTLNLASLTNKTNSIAPAQIIAGNNLTITAQTGDIKNIGANIGSVGALSLSTVKGNILNTAIVQTNDTNLLSQSSDSYQLAFNGSARSSGNISSALLQNASIKGGSIAISAANDFTNLAAKISTTKNALSDGSTSSGDLAVTAGNNVDIGTLQLRNRVETSWGSKKRGGNSVVDTTTNIGSDLTSAGTIDLNTTGTAIGTSITDATDTASNINIVGSNVTSSGDLSLVAKDDVNVASAIDTYHKEEYNHKKGFQSKSTSTSINDTTTNVSSNLTSGGDLSIMSGGDTNVIASNLSATGSGNILAGEYLDLKLTSPTYNTLVTNDNANVNIINGLDTKYSSVKTSKTKMGFSLENAVMTAAMVAAVAFSGGAAAGVIMASGGAGAVAGSVNKQTTKNTTITYDETVVASKLNFGNDLTISSINDTTLKAAKVNSGGDLTINAGNNLLIETASETHSRSNEKNSKGNYFFSNGTSGYQNGNVINTEITSNGGANTNTTFNVGNVTLAQYNKASGDNSTGVTKTGLDGSTLYGDFSNNSTLAYLDKLDSSTTLYNPVEELSKSWDQTNRGLTQAGQAVVAITATALTMGAMDPVSGSWLQGALVAGSSAAASTASIAAINSSVNANGDIFKQLKTISKDTWDTTTSKESVKNIVIAAAAGGLTVGATNYINTGSFTTAANATNSVSTNANAVERVSANFKNSLQEVATQTVASSAAQSAVNGDSFTDAIKGQGKNILIYAAAKVAANEIGRAYHGTPTTLTDSSGSSLTNLDGSVMTSPQIGKMTQLTLHAGLGCAVGAVSGGNCGSGAVAGVVGESVAEAGYGYGGLNQQTSIQLANLAGGIAAGTYGNLTGQSDEKNADNIWTGSRIGQNAAENNNFATDMAADMDEKAWLEGKISDAEYKESQRIKLRNDEIEGNIALAALTVGDAAALYQGARAFAVGRGWISGAGEATTSLSSGTLREGYHATDPSNISSIFESGFLNGSKPGRLGSGGVYVNNTAEGALSEFFYLDQKATQAGLIKVSYNPGAEAISSVAPQGHRMSFPIIADSISAPSIRATNTVNTNILNGSTKPLGSIIITK